ncbi:hypothetical protein [Salinactinospora qingdaonensis]|uniref:hypothetical protein n=1 Tax=Salinactinospora qingdaonensis TaxID=702744 RepID=UPI0031E67474
MSAFGPPLLYDIRQPAITTEKSGKQPHGMGDLVAVATLATVLVAVLLLAQGR